MSLEDKSRGRLKLQDSLRATLLGMTLQVMSDNYLELIDETAPSEQCLDLSIFTNDADEADGRAKKLKTIINEFEKQLEALGVRGLLFIASEGALLDERNAIRTRLYGAP